MALLFVGSSVSDFDAFAPPQALITDPAFLAPNVDEGFHLRNSQQWVRKKVNSSPNFWLSFYIRISSSFSSSATIMRFGYSENPVISSPSISLVGLELSFFGGGCNVSLNGTFIGSISLVVNELVRWDVRLKNDPVNGRLVIYKDGGVVLDYTGDTERVTPVYNMFEIFGNSSALGHYYSGFIMSTADTRTFEMASMSILGEGSVNEWEGTYLDLNEVGLDTDDFMWSDVVGAQTLFNLDKPSIPSGYFVGAVVFSTNGSQYGPSVGGIDAIQKQSGVTEVIGEIPTSDVYFATGQLIAEVNPMTGVRYTPTEYANFEFGFQVQ